MYKCIYYFMNHITVIYESGIHTGRKHILIRAHTRTFTLFHTPECPWERLQLSAVHPAGRAGRADSTGRQYNTLQL